MSLQAHDCTGDGLDAALIMADLPEIGSAASEADRRIAVCAHELRTPIGGMLALADLLLASDLDEAQRRHAGALRQAAGHLLEVADTILDVTRPRAEEASPTRVRFDLRALLQGAVTPLAARGHPRGVAVRLQGVADLPALVAGDAVSLRRILDNLADNALKATEAGEVVLRTAWMRRPGEGGALRLTVEDTGPGFGAAWFQSPERSPAHGGLGLALVGEMAERLGGSVTLGDRPGGGASVTVELPLEPVAAPPERPELRPVAEGRTGLRILVVENNAAMRIAIGSMLDKLGHGYRMVGRGPAAVDHVGRGEADLVLVAAASTVAGVETIRAVRGLGGPCGAVPIFAIVAPGDEAGRAALLATGADAVLTKPVSMRDLGDAIVAAAQRLGDRAAHGVLRS